jgi:hypothetical protein
MNVAVIRAAAAAVLEPLVACGLDQDCVQPVGSSRANHRQEQTALNAILCANSLAAHASLNKAPPRVGPDAGMWAGVLCNKDARFRLTSDFENRNHELQPTIDPTDWNDMVLYTRRGHHHKPYATFVIFSSE